MKRRAQDSVDDDDDDRKEERSRGCDGETPRTRARLLLRRKLELQDVSWKTTPDGKQLTYLSKERSVQIANNVFGSNGWSSTIVSVNVDSVEKKNTPDGPLWDAAVSAIVRITLAEAFGGNSHDDLGYGIAIAHKTRVSALESARKEAVSDALKRALRLFGDYLGNCLYSSEHLSTLAKDKEQQQQQQQQQAEMEGLNKTK